MRSLLSLLALIVAVPTSAGAQQVALPGSTTKPADKTPGVVPKRAPIDGVLVLYGNERCPTNDNNEEIVVCVRRSAQEQYRVPKELREFQVTPENASWAAKVQATLDTGQWRRYDRQLFGQRRGRADGLFRATGRAGARRAQGDEEGRDPRSALIAALGAEQ